MDGATSRSLPEIRVASVPASHWYVRHLSDPEGGDAVRRLPDAGDAAAGWWPPSMLDAAWVEAHHHEFDVFHVHFGFDARGASQIEELCRSLRAHGKPLVYTVHDLRNPHHRDPRAHDSQMAPLIANADVLLTLTEKAASLIEERWGRRAEVVPHPHILPLDRLPNASGTRPACGPVATVGIHMKSLRENMFGPELFQGIAPALESARALRIQVDVHGEAFDDPMREILLDLGAKGLIDLRVHQYFSDDEFYDYVGSIDVAALPYRFGTHSGWLEACRDAGTAVVAPSSGCYSSQAQIFEFDSGLPAPDVWSSFMDAVRRAAAARRRGDVEPVGRLNRLRQRRTIAGRHREIYEQLIAAGKRRRVPA